MIKRRKQYTYFKAGDKVLVRPDLIHSEFYEQEYTMFYDDSVKEVATLGMCRRYASKLVTIEKVYSMYGGGLKYLIKEDGGTYYWTDEMFCYNFTV